MTHWRINIIEEAQLVQLYRIDLVTPLFSSFRSRTGDSNGLSMAIETLTRKFFENLFRICRTLHFYLNRFTFAKSCLTLSCWWLK